MQHFANLAGQAVISMAGIDVLTRQLLELTAEVPYYAATVARARLTKAHQQLQTRLVNSDNAWPGESVSHCHTSLHAQLEAEVYSQPG